jgi:hypothetical protein
VTPDTAPIHVTPMVVLAPQTGAGAKVIEHVASSDFRPPPMPWEMQQNQAVSNSVPVDAASEARTE